MGLSVTTGGQERFFRAKSSGQVVITIDGPGADVAIRRLPDVPGRSLFTIDYGPGLATHVTVEIGEDPSPEPDYEEPHGEGAPA